MAVNRPGMLWWEVVVFWICFLITCGIFGMGVYCLERMML
jgi:hypothetical protein